MALTISVANNEDGTGAVATIAGADAATVTVYVAPMASSAVWSSAGTRSGNGTLSLSIAVGQWLAYASGTVSGSPANSAPVVFSVSDDAESIQDQCEAAILAKIQTLTLTGLATPPGDLINFYRFPSLNEIILTNMTLPAVVVVPGLGAETNPGVMNSTDDVGYPVTAVIIDRCPPHVQGPTGSYKKWRQQIARAIRNQHLAAVPSIMTVQIEPGPVLAWKPPDYDYIYSSITFRCLNREQRGA